MQQNDIYIVLTATGTLFSQTIKWFTKAPLNHASISFDSELKEVYSFGRKKITNPFIAGFIQEDFKDPFYRSASCAVYRIPVDHEAYEKMRHHIAEMKRRPERYKYHLLGLIGVLIRKRIPRENAYFCSHFVASVMEQNGCRPVDKPAHFVTPGDFEQSLTAHQVYRGTISEYFSRLGRGLTA
ncbi:hypothetical protein ACF3MZ_09095 [Paenibacillaceae bacterium WGS1546]|uniref:hypothetical protein n=1 Tax=Cohnella sp. WGS1546 TaxID=3366810 RepID=UPI00372D02C1